MTGPRFTSVDSRLAEASDGPRETIARLPGRVRYFRRVRGAPLDGIGIARKLYSTPSPIQ
jgi:hypothetical protein